MIRALGLGLALWLGGCAQIHGVIHGSSESGEASRTAAWLGFLGGEDLRLQCGATVSDAFRLVWRRADGEFRVLEVIGNEAGGALMLHRSFSPAEMADGAPPTTLPEARQRHPLSPDGFAGLVYWFGRLGMFAPVPGTPGEPGAGLEWLIASCLDGTWSLGVHLPAAGGKDGEPRVSFRRFPGALAGRGA